MERDLEWDEVEVEEGVRRIGRKIIQRKKTRTVADETSSPRPSKLKPAQLACFTSSTAISG